MLYVQERFVQNALHTIIFISVADALPLILRRNVLYLGIFGGGGGDQRTVLAVRGRIGRDTGLQLTHSPFTLLAVLAQQQ